MCFDTIVSKFSVENSLYIQSDTSYGELTLFWITNYILVYIYLVENVICFGLKFCYFIFVFSIMFTLKARKTPRNDF